MKKILSLVALGLCLSPTVYAKHKPMTMDCSQPMHAKMSFCKKQAAEKAAAAKAAPATKVDHSKMDHSKMAMPEKETTTKPVDHSKMDHSKMAMPANKAATKTVDHSKMNHAAMPTTKIPVSDGSLDTDVPMPFPGAMHMNDDPILGKVMIDALEYRYADSNNTSLNLDAEAWLGKDLHKLWLKADIESVDGKIEEAEVQALYNRAIDPNWDLQVGIRKDIEPVSREWAVVGLQGTAPYMFDVGASVFFGKGGQVGARLNAEYELMLSQKTVLAPELGMNFYTKDDAAAGFSSGLSDIGVALRLKHEFKREFAPYVGVNWSKSFGEDASDTQLLLGLEAWF